MPHHPFTPSTNPTRPSLSLIVPTRRRPDQLQSMLASLRANAARPHTFEVVLVIDSDDPGSVQVHQYGLRIRRVVVPPGQPMGALNMTGYLHSAGDFIMLLNDDVRARTKGWDDRILAACQHFLDRIALVHVNDTIFQDALCTFPVVSRAFCELAGGVCPPQYLRYRIDDHIDDVFNLLVLLGTQRTIYMPDVIFEHLNKRERSIGHNGYQPQDSGLAADAPRFEALFEARKELALRLLRHIDGPSTDAREAERREQLARISDPYSLRYPGRQLIQRGMRPPRRGSRLMPPGPARLWAGRSYRQIAKIGRGAQRLLTSAWSSF